MSSPVPVNKDEDLDVPAVVENELDRWRNILFTFTMDRTSSDDERHLPWQAETNETSSVAPGQTQTRSLAQLSITPERYDPLGAFPLSALGFPAGLQSHHGREYWQHNLQGKGILHEQNQYLPLDAHSSSITSAETVTSQGGSRLKRLQEVPASAGTSLIEGEKRRRNTEASARFRSKKKERNLDLEQTITALSGKAEVLEKEAEDLRKENGWLKEIVIMKSRVQRGGTRPSEAQSDVSQEEGTSLQPMREKQT